jgi:hypothetical protein
MSDQNMHREQRFSNSFGRKRPLHDSVKAMKLLQTEEEQQSEEEDDDEQQQTSAIKKARLMPEGCFSLPFSSFFKNCL